MAFIQGLKDSLTRDVLIQRKGDALPVRIDQDLQDEGWVGGTYVRWVISPQGDFMVAKANGLYCGFFAFGSSESADQFTALTNQNTTYQYAILFCGGNFMYTRTFETLSYQSRHGLVPPTPLIYTPNQTLFVSENGKITNERESLPSVQGVAVPIFPDGSPITTEFEPCGFCIQPPSDLTNNYLAIQTF